MNISQIIYNKKWSYRQIKKYVVLIKNLQFVITGKFLWYSKDETLQDVLLLGNK